MNACVATSLVLLVVVVTANAAGAQDRLPAIPNDKLSEDQLKASAEFAKIRGTAPFGPFIPLLRSPEVMVRVSALGEQLRYKSALPPRLSELAILIIARQWTQQYEWYVHEPIALKAGVSRDTVKAIAEGRRPERMTDHEEIIYAVCDELHRTKRVSDATYARAVAALGERGAIDTAAIVGYYTLLAMVMNTAQTALPDGVKHPLTPLP